MAASFEITIIAGCSNERIFSPLDADGEALIAEAADVLRFKIGRGDGSTPVLDLRSGEDTANGSGIDISDIDPLTLSVRVAQEDATMHPGIYRGFLGIVDDSETAPANAFKPISIGVVYVVGMLGGPVDQDT